LNTTEPSGTGEQFQEPDIQAFLNSDPDEYMEELIDFDDTPTPDIVPPIATVTAMGSGPNELEESRLVLIVAGPIMLTQ
jgi:hypothetical protein